MSKRSPVHGYNHNFKHRGLIFHIQTEDSGVDNPHLFTHLFHSGGIIASQKTDYNSEISEDVVKTLMQKQHKVMVKGLRTGDFDDKIDQYLGHKKELLPRRISKEEGATQAGTQPQDGIGLAAHDDSKQSIQSQHAADSQPTPREQRRQSPRSVTGRPVQPPFVPKPGEPSPQQRDTRGTPLRNRSSDPRLNATEPLVAIPEPSSYLSREEETRARRRAPTEPATTPISAAISSPVAAHSGAISLDTPRRATIANGLLDDTGEVVPIHIAPTGIPSHPVASTTPAPNHTRIEANESMDLEVPLARSTQYRHERNPIPTPISMPAVNPDELPDPIVTFSAGGASSSKSVPSRISADSPSERSATYSMKRDFAAKSPPKVSPPKVSPPKVSPPKVPPPKVSPPGRSPSAARPRVTRLSPAGPKALRTAAPNQRPTAPRSPSLARARPSAALRSTDRPSGKAANPVRGVKSSSVVVSRPSVIVGAAAKTVGKTIGRSRSRPSKDNAKMLEKTSEKTNRGNGVVSEKSLDEVIMAYLSEDHKGDK